MSTQDDQFVALGPDLGGQAAFVTRGANIELGGHFEGTLGGVAAICNNLQGTALTAVGVNNISGGAAAVTNNGPGPFCIGLVASSLNGKGISGSGALNGVFGLSIADDGVRGEARAATKSGVFGINHDNTTAQGFGISGTTNSENSSSFGVFGFANGAGGVGGDSKRGNGVHGHSVVNDGVRGDSDASGKSGVFGFNTISTGDQAFGVSGSTSSGNLFSFGVFGFADLASGVGGNSKAGYGGHFSGGRAPLRLTPSTTTGHPTDPGHQVGELFVDSQGTLYYYNGTAWKQVVLA